MLSQLTYGLTHIPEVIIPLFQSVGNWGYLCLFLITFMETGLVVFPWLPGESLIFVATSLSAVSTNQIHIEILLPGFFIAALLGGQLLDRHPANQAPLALQTPGWP